MSNDVVVEPGVRSGLKGNVGGRVEVWWMKKTKTRIVWCGSKVTAPARAVSVFTLHAGVAARVHLAKVSSALRVRTSTCRLHSCRLCSVLNLQERPRVSMQHASCRHSSSQIRPCFLGYFQHRSHARSTCHLHRLPSLSVFKSPGASTGIHQVFLISPSLFQIYSCVRYCRLSTIRISPPKHPPLSTKNA